MLNHCWTILFVVILYIPHETVYSILCEFMQCEIHILWKIRAKFTRIDEFTGCEPVRNRRCEIHNLWFSGVKSTRNWWIHTVWNVRIHSCERHTCANFVSRYLVNSQSVKNVRIHREFRHGEHLGWLIKRSIATRPTPSGRSARCPNDLLFIRFGSS